MEETVDVSTIAMVREWPVRSAITIGIPLLFAVGQLANGYIHDVSLLYPGLFAVLFVALAVFMVRQQVAAFRTSQLESAYSDNE